HAYLPIPRIVFLCSSGRHFLPSPRPPAQQDCQGPHSRILNRIVPVVRFLRSDEEDVYSLWLTILWWLPKYRSVRCTALFPKELSLDFFAILSRWLIRHRYSYRDPIPCLP